MKGLKKIRALCVALVAVMMFGVFATPAQAYVDSRYIDHPINIKTTDVVKHVVVGKLQEGTKTSVKPFVEMPIDFGKTKYTFYYYKIKVPSDGFLDLTVEGCSSCIAISRSRPRYDAPIWYGDPTGIPCGGPRSPEKRYVAVEKGTYYLTVGEVFGYDSYITYKFCPTKKQKNISKRTAYKLKSNKIIGAIQTPKNNSDKYYKIKLSKNQRIKVYFYGMTSDVRWISKILVFPGRRLSSVPAHVEMMGLIGAGNNPMVGMTVSVAVAVEEAAREGKF